MASKSMASTAALFVAMALILAASKQAQARPPAPTPAPTPMTPAPAPAPGPSQGFCPTGFRNIIEFTKAVPEYDAMGVLLSFSVYPPSSGLPGVVVGSRTCICYFPNIYAILFLGPLDCVAAA
ncbi:unnamed protein product [Urochloa decumbens]|uniref:Uncharacterized protein n=1 Tax=Urochloa decumbens TaxID=240449 RepID=A0ABC8WB91_9POAL